MHEMKKKSFLVLESSPGISSSEISRNSCDVSFESSKDNQLDGLNPRLVREIGEKLNTYILSRKHKSFSTLKATEEDTRTNTINCVLVRYIPEMEEKFTENRKLKNQIAVFSITAKTLMIKILKWSLAYWNLNKENHKQQLAGRSPVCGRRSYVNQQKIRISIQQSFLKFDFMLCDRNFCDLSVLLSVRVGDFFAFENPHFPELYLVRKNNRQKRLFECQLTSLTALQVSRQSLDKEQEIVQLMAELKSAIPGLAGYQKEPNDAGSQVRPFTITFILCISLLLSLILLSGLRSTKKIICKRTLINNSNTSVFSFPQRMANDTFLAGLVSAIERQSVQNIQNAVVQRRISFFAWDTESHESLLKSLGFDIIKEVFSFYRWTADEAFNLKLPSVLESNTNLTGISDFLLEFYNSRKKLVFRYASIESEINSNRFLTTSIEGVYWGSNLWTNQRQYLTPLYKNKSPHFWLKVTTDILIFVFLAGRLVFKTVKFCSSNKKRDKSFFKALSFKLLKNALGLFLLVVADLCVSFFFIKESASLYSLRQTSLEYYFQNIGSWLYLTLCVWLFIKYSPLRYLPPCLSRWHIFYTAYLRWLAIVVCHFLLFVLVYTLAMEAKMESYESFFEFFVNSMRYIFLMKEVEWKNAFEISNFLQNFLFFLIVLWTYLLALFVFGGIARELLRCRETENEFIASGEDKLKRLKSE